MARRTTEEIVDFLKQAIEDVSESKIKKDMISADAKILSELGLDSLDYAQSMLSCEEWLNIKVREDEVDWRKVQSVLDLAELLERTQP